MIRDTTLIPNVLWFEYTTSRQEARARGRKMAALKPTQWRCACTRASNNSLKKRAWRLLVAAAITLLGGFIISRSDPCCWSLNIVTLTNDHIHIELCHHIKCVCSPVLLTQYNMLITNRYSQLKFEGIFI